MAAALAGSGSTRCAASAVDRAGPGSTAARKRPRGRPGTPRSARSRSSTGAAAVLLGHTRDDQAETVLLGLARGSGARALAGMAARRGRYRRPLLAVGRRHAAGRVRGAGPEPWDDPHNADPRLTRARVRHEALPALEDALGPGVAEALARTAAQLRADADALDAHGGH